jgi:hypothetical protein
VKLCGRWTDQTRTSFILRDCHSRNTSSQLHAVLTRLTHERKMKTSEMRMNTAFRIASGPTSTTEHELSCLRVSKQVMAGNLHGMRKCAKISPHLYGMNENSILYVRTVPITHRIVRNSRLPQNVNYAPLDENSLTIFLGDLCSVTRVDIAIRTSSVQNLTGDSERTPTDRLPYQYQGINMKTRSEHQRTEQDMRTSDRRQRANT